MGSVSGRFLADPQFRFPLCFFTLMKFKVSFLSFSFSMHHKYYLMGVGVVFSPLEAHHLVKPHINFTSLQRNINDSNAHICTCSHRLRRRSFSFSLLNQGKSIELLAPPWSSWKSNFQAKECRRAILNCVAKVFA